MHTFEIVVRRGWNGGLEITRAAADDVAGAVQARRNLVAEFMRDGFTGKRNAAGVYHLAKRDGGKRVRITVYIRPVLRTYGLN